MAHPRLGTSVLKTIQFSSTLRAGPPSDGPGAPPGCASQKEMVGDGRIKKREGVVVSDRKVQERKGKLVGEETILEGLDVAQGGKLGSFLGKEERGWRKRSY